MALASNNTATAPHPRRLISFAGGVYVLIIIIASLYPFSGWQDRGLPLFFFLQAGWPRYWTAFDLITNIIAYLPLGYLLTLSFWQENHSRRSACLAVIAATLLSLTMEVIQAWLPSRVSSNIDLLCNTLGAALGALLAHYHGRAVLHTLSRLLQQLLNVAQHTELGLLLIGLWLLTQLSPEIQLFGTGDIRPLLTILPSVTYDPPSFFALEAAITACNMVAIGLMAQTLIAHNRLKTPTLLLLFVLALLVRTLSAAILDSPSNALAWFTPGAALGLLIGGLLLLFSFFLTSRFQQVLAVFMLMTGTILVNICALNPYSQAALTTWQQGHFLNFNGLTFWVASLWPFVTIFYLLLMLKKRASMPTKNS